MKRPIAIGALIACAAALASFPLLGAETLPWPWKDKTPPDPALVTLYKVDTVSAVINDLNPPTVSISVEAVASTPGFTELQLTPRMGDPNDLIFAFDAKGRPPQGIIIQVLKPVTISAEYTDAPIDKVGVVEVYSQSNCKAFSIKDKKEVECISKSIPR